MGLKNNRPNYVGLSLKSNLNWIQYNWDTVAVYVDFLYMYVFDKSFFVKIVFFLSEVAYHDRKKMQLFQHFGTSYSTVVT